MELCYPVQLVRQSTETNCWQAAAAMVLGERREDVGIGRGHRRLSGALRTADDSMEGFASSHGLTLLYRTSFTPQGFYDLLNAHGPLMISGMVPDAHAMVIGGIRGDGTPDGTDLIIYDPWPWRQGTYAMSVQDFYTTWPEATHHIMHLPSRWSWRPSPPEPASP